MYSLLDTYGGILSENCDLKGIKTAAQRVSQGRISKGQVWSWRCGFVTVRNPKSHKNEEDSAKLFEQFAQEAPLPRRNAGNIVAYFTMQAIC